MNSFVNQSSFQRAKSEVTVDVFMSDVNTGGMFSAMKDAKNSRQLMQVSSEKPPNINSIVPELLGKRLLGTRLSVYYLITTFDSFICIPIHKNMSLAII